MERTRSNPRIGRLSVVILSRDEARWLRSTLDSVREIADEIIVVETGNVSATQQVAIGYGGKVVTHRWTKDFSSARNRGLEAAQGSWILLLNAGECLAAGSATSLRSFVDQAKDSRKALLIMVQVPVGEADRSVEQTAQIRLVPRHPGIGYTGRICETLHDSLIRTGMQLELSPWKIDAKKTSHNLEHDRQETRERLELIDLAIGDRMVTPEVLLALGELRAKLGQHDEAADCFRRVIEQTMPGSTPRLEAYYGLLTVLNAETNRREQQIALGLTALNEYPFDAQLLCAMGSYLQAQGRHDVATRSYRLAWERGQVDPQTWHVRDIAELAASCLSLCLQIQDQDDEARQVLEAAVARHPGSTQVINHLLHLYVKQGELKRALALADEYPGEWTGREALRSTVRGACLAAKESWIPARSYLAAAYQAGCRHVLCLRWYSVTLLAMGFQQEADPVLAEWQRIEPRNPEIAAYRQGSQDERAATSTAGKSLAMTAAMGTSSSHQTSAEQLRYLRIDSAWSPQDAGVHFRLGEAYRCQGDLQAAEATWRDFLKRCPGSPQITQALCEILLRTDRSAEALEQARTIKNFDAAGRPFWTFVAGISAFEAGQWQPAHQHFELAKQAGYRDPLLAKYWSLALIRLGRAEEARKLCEEFAPRGTWTPISRDISSSPRA
jgi:tetratricopeptide (TPR) repeat protein